MGIHLLTRELLPDHSLCIESTCFLSQCRFGSILSCPAYQTIFSKLLSHSSFLFKWSTDFLGFASD
jgi:hypothetical protein